MPGYRLRNHIPLGAPATREPYDGSEADLRVSLGFDPRWYRDRVGVDFGESWHLNPEYRYSSLVAMKEHLHRLFPSVPYFKPEYTDGVERRCATISGVNGIMVVSMLYGLSPLYREDAWPDAEGGKHLSKEELIDLPPIDLESHPAVRQLMEQIDLLERRYGWAHGYLNYQGVLNIAFKVRGSEIFIDMMDDPDFAHFLFRHVADTIGRLSKLVQARQRDTGFSVNLLSMSNCVMNMISPDQYEEFILPHDVRLSTEYERFGIHTCNWNADPYLQVLRRIEKMGYLDTGMMSDLVRIREMFPDARRAVLYPPVALASKSLPEIRSDLDRIVRDYAPCDLVMADVDTTTPDSRVREFLDLADGMNR